MVTCELWTATNAKNPGRGHKPLSLVSSRWLSGRLFSRACWLGEEMEHPTSGGSLGGGNPEHLLNTQAPLWCWVGFSEWYSDRLKLCQLYFQVLWGLYPLAVTLCHPLSSHAQPTHCSGRFWLMGLCLSQNIQGAPTFTHTEIWSHQLSRALRAATSPALVLAAALLRLRHLPGIWIFISISLSLLISITLSSMSVF